MSVPLKFIQAQFGGTKIVTHFHASFGFGCVYKRILFVRAHREIGGTKNAPRFKIVMGGGLVALRSSEWV